LLLTKQQSLNPETEIMKTNRRNNAFFFTLSFASCLPLAASAGGFRLPDQDAFATARGEAFVATADNASAIFYNPAGIAQLEGQNIRGGIYGIDINTTFHSPAPPAGNGGSFGNGNKLHAVPQIFYTFSPTNLPVAFGLGIYSPYGLSLEWPDNTGFRTVGTQASLTYLTINPSVAFKLSPNFSIGGGITANYADADLQQGLLPFPYNNSFEFKGSGWAVGYNFGLLWKPIEQISFGASFHSATKFNLTGRTETTFTGVLPAPVNNSASGEFPFPLNAVLGVSYRPTPKWNLEFDADYTDWSTLGTVTIQQSAPIIPLGIPQNIPIAFNWQPSWYYEFGATRYFDNGWHLSAGYIFNESAVPDANYSPVVADEDRHFISIGTGFKGQHFNFDIAYQFGYGPARTVSGSAPSAAGQTADGTYDFISQAVLLTMGWHF
jgi:long-chain fatty acid transport protein